MASNLHSNAFNFLSFMSHQVDPRTGQYTASVNFPDINANNLCGPAFPLNLNFNPLNTLDSGFGTGWSWQLSQYDPTTEILTLSTGEALRVSNWIDAKAEFNEQKLVTFNFYSEGADTYRIEHKSGLSERLSLYGSLYLPKELYSAQGHKLAFAYTPVTTNTGVIYALEHISDAQGTALVSISGLGSSELKILLYSGFSQDSNALSTYEWRSVPGSFETRVTLPTDDHAYWNFTFTKLRNLLCITEVLTPDGAHEYVRYEDGGHGHPAGDEFRIPRVTHHVIKPGAGQDDINYKYTYVLPKQNNQHNFLGYHAPGLVWGNTGYDNLYQVVADYKYGSIQSLLDGNATVNSIVRIYNRFHLLTREEIQQSGH
ncbi:MAG: sugar-binding protein, partial [Pseudomonas sp.]|nr:sugar-binding protein [Pseudomonas sp.]